MSGGPWPPETGPHLLAAWNRVAILLANGTLPEAFRVEALRRTRQFYCELQDLAEGVGFVPGGRGVFFAGGVAAPPGQVGGSSVDTSTSKAAPPVPPAHAGPSELRTVEPSASVPPQSEVNTPAAGVEEKDKAEPLKKKKKKSKEKKEKKNKRHRKSKSLATDTPPATPVAAGELGSPVREIPVEEAPEVEEEEEKEDEGEESVEPVAPERKEERSPREIEAPARETPARRRSSPALSDKERRDRAKDKSRRRSSRERRRRSRSRSRRERRGHRSREGERRELRPDTRRPSEPVGPPIWRGSAPTGPPPGIFDRHYARSGKSKGVQHRIRNRDIRAHGTDAERKAARVENYYSGGHR